MGEKNGKSTKIRNIFYIIVATLGIAATCTGGIYSAAKLVQAVDGNCETVDKHDLRIKATEKFVIEAGKDLSYLKSDAEEQKKERESMLRMQRTILEKLG